ncbi:MAG: retropepsin-like aspartic protease [Planctomycetota bacterium]
MNRFCRTSLERRHAGWVRWTCWAVVCLPLTVHADPPAESERPPHSTAVVAKADAILQAAGLRRSGSTLQSLQAADFSRMMSQLSRQRRELKLIQVDLDSVSASIERFNGQIKLLEGQDGQLNLQLARIAAGDVTTNNKIVAMINATRTLRRQMQSQRDDAVKAEDQQRGRVHDAQANYAESIYQLRRRFDELAETIDTSLTEPNVIKAVGVMNRNFAVPTEINAAEVLAPVEKRLRLIEREVFRREIALDVQSNGSMMVTVSINQKPIRMIIDTGATVMVLPNSSVAELELEVPADAPLRRVILANGQPIAARQMRLPSVRIGEFEAKDVAAVILGPEATNADPLLGMSYLKRFEFELDAPNRELKLLRVGP